ncbi:dehydrogenase E1 component [Chloroherpeton thalassium ATCC 35110]|uniref:3-methyl-2-oxobutanoate dehydrogenase (2-methylpropanoyl-transferring) n=1 Tax=Chloroherpeton thalassium (strain ATCC 35110 / GB-78) TaxID=517418 RepID=B3QUJ4_CHLT3|nr:dehydrogenase E1 component subunit alpha/beta [Chloroherpeton thalassium]ACF12900.1 dehydrogenase E1 component [Chloroherpeton thalassium ATCC 35110]
MMLENVEGLDIKHRNSNGLNHKYNYSVTISKEQILRAYTQIYRTRQLDNKLLILLRQGKAPFHVGAAGHEIAQVAMAMHIKPGQDWSYPYYRDLAYCLELGMSVEDVVLEFLAKDVSPISGGRQMYGHWSHNDLRIPTQSSPTGSQYLHAAGTAIACKRENELRKEGEKEIVFVSSGEGATSEGEFHEALNWATREKLPVVFLIEDNGYAISVPIEEQTTGQSIYKVAAGYSGLTRFDVDGGNFFEMYAAAQKAVDICRRGDGPCLIRASVVRLLPHSSSDNQAAYRSQDELESDKKRDGLLRLEKHILTEGVLSQKELTALQAEIYNKIEAAVTWALKQEDPRPESHADFVVSAEPPPISYESTTPQGRSLFMVESINQALAEELEHNPKMMVYGEDVGNAKGGVFSATKGLSEKFGKGRVFNSQLAENSIIGTAVGLAFKGYKPVVEIQFGDYIWPGMMQIRNELALIRYRSKGCWSSPVVVRVAIGGYIHGAMYHSQNVEGFLAHIPGLFVVYPSNAADAKGLLKTACRMDDPVIFLEHKYLYRQGFAKSPEPDKNYFLPFGKARVVQSGNDATVITYGATVRLAQEAAAKIQEETNRTIEILDLRTIIPYDKEAIAASVKKTGKVLVLHEDTLTQGFGGEIIAFISENCFEFLDAPVYRLGAADTPVPNHPNLELAVLPSKESVYRKLAALVAY